MVKTIETEKSLSMHGTKIHIIMTGDTHKKVLFHFVLSYLYRVVHIFILSNFHLLHFNVLCFHIFISPHFHISILSYFRVSTHPYFHIAEIFWPVLTYSDTSNLYLFWTGLSLWMSKWVSEWVKDMTSRKAIASKKLHHMQIEIVAHYLE